MANITGSLKGFIFIFLLFVFFRASEFPLAGADLPSPLPGIPRLDSRDTVFRQYLEDVENSRLFLFSYRQGLPDRAGAGKIASAMTIYSYIPPEAEDLLAIAARCNISYAAIASLNRLSHKEDIVPGTVLLLPSAPGIFIPENPDTDLERLLFSTWADSAEDSGVTLSIPREGKTERFLFIPGGDFSPAERIFFLNPGFRFPLARFEVSSRYGPRVNPVTGRAGVHRGIDLAAPSGTDVYAVRSGTVVDTGEDPILGKYVIINHENDWISLYGHLSEIHTHLHAELRSGNLIAKVGSTGQSTGPHLHFELRQNGQSRDPAKLLGIFKEKKNNE